MTADRITALEDALTLAANRLHRVALDFDTGSRRLIEVLEWADEARASLAASSAASDCHQQDLVTAQCCMCGRTELSTAEDGGPECELDDGRWVCSRDCYDRAVDGPTAQDAARVPEIAALIEKAAEVYEASDRPGSLTYRDISGGDA